MRLSTQCSKPVSVRSVALATALMLAPSLMFVTRQSLWADEACSAWFALHARSLNPAQFPGMLGAVSQMPGYHLLLLAWVRVAGDSERTLRALNIPFAAIFLASLLTLCRWRTERLWWLPAAPFAFFPLLLYYINEARPYAALSGLSCAATAALLVHLRTNSRMSAWTCAVCTLAVFTLHLLGFLTLMALACFVLFTRGFVRHARTLAVPALATLPGYVVLLPYYAHVHGAGTGHAAQALLQADIPGNITASWKNCVFVLYEALGFSGLGPPRNDLRIHAGLHSFHGYWLTMLPGLAASVLLLWLLLRRNSYPARRLLAAAFAGLVVLFLLARATHFGFFGRHAVPLAGCFCCALVLLLSRRGNLSTAATLLLTAAWVLSSARLLLLYPYGKDDPRAALATAVAAASREHLPIFWNAGREEAVYYGAFDPQRSQDLLFTLPPAVPAVHGQGRIPIHVLSPQPQHVPAGDAILVQGKTDTFDPAGYWTAVLLRARPQLLAHDNGFRVYRVRFP